MMPCPSCNSPYDPTKGSVCLRCGWQFSSAGRDGGTVPMPAAAATPVMSAVRSHVKRPDWICANVKQAVVSVRDDSPSMEEDQKGVAASMACQDLLAELAQPCNKDGFFFGVIDFHGSAHVVADLQKATVLNGKVPPLFASGTSGSMTNITSGLELSLRMLGQTPVDPTGRVQYLRPVVILYSDGCHNEGKKPYAAANRLKQVADVVAVAFGTDADEAMLKRIASTPQHFYRCSNGRELRKFLAAVGATMTATLAVRTNATIALTTIRQ